MIRYALEEHKVTIYLDGRIDTSNAEEFDSEIKEIYRQHPQRDYTFDVSELDYISSVGLRTLLTIRKKKGESIPIINASDSVYEIFDVTAFTDIFDVSRRPKEIDINNLKFMMNSLNGSFYRQSDDTMVKLYAPGITLEQVQKERELARKALILGVPTVIPFEVGVCKDRYGIFLRPQIQTLWRTL